MEFLRLYIYEVCLLVVIGSAIALALSLLASGHDQFALVFLDVGQGDSILVSGPDGADLLIDGGRDQKTLAELDDVLESDLEAVLLTHSDADHVGALPEVITSFNPQYIISNPSQSDSEIYASFESALLASDAEQISLVAGEAWRLGCCVNILVIAPTAGLVNSLTVDPNSRSIGVLVSYGEFDVYLGGDLHTEQEVASLAYLPSREVEVLKASHHGSNSSSGWEFIGDLLPDHAVISAGLGNSYGHPHADVLRNLERASAEIWRTDLQGRITFKSDGLTYQVTSTTKLD